MPFRVIRDAFTLSTMKKRLPPVGRVLAVPYLSTGFRNSFE